LVYTVATVYTVAAAAAAAAAATGEMCLKKTFLRKHDPEKILKKKTCVSNDFDKKCRLLYKSTTFELLDHHHELNQKK